MGDAKWVKFEVNMFDDTKLKIIDNMTERDSIHYIWTRLIVLAGKINCGGYFCITDNIAYTIKTFAIEFNRSIEEVKTAIKVLKKIEMIEFTEDKVFKIKNWDKHQNVEGLERLRNQNNQRVAKHRAKKKENKESNEEEVSSDVLEINESNTQINNNEEINNNEGINNNREINNNEEINDKHNLIKHDEENTSIVIKELADSKDNIVENINIIDNNSNDSCNVTYNDSNSSCNITVMEQKKKEKKNKIENKMEKKIESDFSVYHEKNNNIIEFFESADSQKPKINTSSQEAASLLTYYENITGIVGKLNFGAIKLAIDMHGEKQVKKAIDKALELNKMDMPYINGILKNWKRKGYPEDDVEVKKNGFTSIGKSNKADKNEFTGFKPKKPRDITEKERKGAQKELI